MKNLLVFIFVLTPFLFFAQGVYNNGANIVISSGSYIIVDGGTNGNYLSENNGLIDIDGIMQIEGNFTNNSVNNAFSNVDSDGEFIFAGTTQNIISPIANFADFEKITINNGSTTTLAAASGLTANGTLTVNGTLVSATPSDETIGGSIITTTGAGAVTGTGTININRYFNVNGRWQYVSVPMTNQQSDLFTENTTSGNFNPNFYIYNETFDQTAMADPSDISYSNYDYGSGYNFWEAWTQVQATAGAPVALDPAIGYICYNEGDLNTVFTTGAGNPDRLNHSASYSPAVSYTLNDCGNIATDFYDGWNLIGNPYQSALDWDVIKLPANLTNFATTVYMWDGDNGNYIYYNNGDGTEDPGDGQTLNSDATARYIPPMQSFMVKATAAAPSITIPATARVHYDKQLYKSDNNTPSFDYIKLQIEHNGMNDQTLVRFLNNASEDIDNQYDAYKMYATTVGLPQISSIVDINGTSTPLAINSLPIENVEYKAIPLSIVAKNSGDYSFTAPELNTYELRNFYLADYVNEEPIFTDLSLQPNYSVYLEEGEYQDRFYLFALYSTTPIENFNNNLSSVNIYSNQKWVFLKINNQKDISGQLSVFDILGKELFRTDVSSNYNEYDLMHLPTGTYIVKYISKNQTVSQKIILN